MASASNVTLKALSAAPLFILSDFWTFQLDDPEPMRLRKFQEASANPVLQGLSCPSHPGCTLTALCAYNLLLLVIVVMSRQLVKYDSGCFCESVFE